MPDFAWNHFNKCTKSDVCKGMCWTNMLAHPIFKMGSMTFVSQMITSKGMSSSKAPKSVTDMNLLVFLLVFSIVHHNFNFSSVLSCLLLLKMITSFLTIFFCIILVFTIIIIIINMVIIFLCFFFLIILIIIIIFIFISIFIFLLCFFHQHHFLHPIICFFIRLHSLTLVIRFWFLFLLFIIFIICPFLFVLFVLFFLFFSSSYFCHVHLFLSCSSFLFFLLLRGEKQAAGPCKAALPTATRTIIIIYLVPLFLSLSFLLHLSSPC